MLYRVIAIAPLHHRHRIIAPSLHRTIAPSRHRHRAIVPSTCRLMMRWRWRDGDDAIEHRVIVIAPLRYRHRAIVIASSHHRPTSRWYDGAIVKCMALSGFHSHVICRWKSCTRIQKRISSVQSVQLCSIWWQPLYPVSNALIAYTA